MTREELFKKAKEQRKKEKEQEAQRKNQNFNFNYENIMYSALDSTPKVYRLLGNPVSYREVATDPKIIHISFIRGDNDKLFRCIWPDRSENPDWILWKILRLVLDYEYDSATNSRIYKYAKTHPTVFNKIFKNGVPQNTYERGWTPQTLVVWNVIDREMEDWHKKNNHTVLLSKKVRYYENAKGESMASYTAGIPLMLYQLIFDDVVEYYGDWENYDIAITKLQENPFYKVANILEHPKEFSQELVAIAKEGELTTEEKLYEKYDLDKLFKVTSYRKIYNRLKITIKQIDEAFKTNYLEELLELVEKEKEEWEEKDPDPEFEKEFKEFEKNTNTQNIPKTTTVTESPDTITNPINTTTQSPNSESPVRNVRQPISSEIDWEKIKNVYEYKGIDKLMEEEKNLIIGFNETSGELIYKEGETLYLCNHCNAKSPGTFHVCPKCGSVFA